MKKSSKKAFAILIAIFLVAISTGAYAAETRLVFGTGPVGAVFTPIASGIAAIIHENIPGVSVTLQATVGGPENARLTGAGELDLGLTPADMAYYANNNEGPFAGENLSLKTLGALHATTVQIVTLKNSGLKEFEQLKGKKVSIGEPGGGAEFAFKQTMEGLGWAESDVNMLFLPPDQAMDQLADGLLDAVCLMGGIPTPAVTTLATQRDIDLINYNPFVAEKLGTITSLFSFIDVDPKSYKGMDRAVTTPAQRVMFICSATMDEELAYKITKAVYENLDKLKTYHSVAATISREAAPTVSAPLNAGAERYFKEAGLMK